MKIFTIIFFLIIFSFNLSAQSTGSYYNPKDDTYKLLGLKRAKELYESAQSDYDRQKQLFTKSMISIQAFEKAKSIYADAEVNYQQALLAVLFESQYVSVVKAIKYQDKNGSKHVKLTLANTSSGGGEFKKLINIDDDLFNSLQPEIVNDVYISILNDANAIISQPYEAKIEQLLYGKPVTVDFVILQDLDEVTVNIIYGSGTHRAPKIFLQKDQTVNKVILQSEQFSQEVDLGQEAIFNMTLELFSGITNTYKLEVVNLPNQINRYFVDPVSQARLSQFKFTESTQTRRAGLNIFLPDRPTDEVTMDKPISFYVMAIPFNKQKEFNKLRDKEWTLKNIEDFDVGYVKLELIPRGQGELLIKVPQLFLSVLPKEKISFPIDIINEGSRRLDNVEFQIDLPLSWTKKITPLILESLDIREEKRVVLELYPPNDISAGKYDIRIRTTSLSDQQVVEGEDKNLTVEIQNETSILWTGLLILLILGLVVGIIVFGIKLSKK